MINRIILSYFSQMANVYFERQGCLSMSCGLHAINNLKGHKALNETDMNQICEQLSSDYINPYRSIFGGDYSVQILILALKKVGSSVEWHDQRKQIVLDKLIEGYLINCQSTQNPLLKGLCCCLSLRHWYIIKPYEQNYVELNSKKEQPIFVHLSNIVTYLQNIRQNNGIIIKVYSTNGQ